MDEHPGGEAPAHLASDADLVARTRDGDRTAFGVLYLRHHAAAWRLASATSGFSDDAELAVLAGFTNVFGALPARGEAPFRPYLLASVRHAALERCRTRRPKHPGEDQERDPDAVRAALAALPETRRTALWLTDVEAMTPTEVAAVVGLDARAVPRLANEARATVREACREATLVDAAAPPPLLGGECQRHWLTHREEVRPAFGPRHRRETRGFAPLTAVATAVAAMVFGLPIGGTTLPDEPTTVAVSPFVRAYLPDTAAD